MSEAVPILMYHGVSADAQPRFRQFVVSPRRFAEQMEHLSETGYESCTITQLVARRARGDTGPERAVVITFDDAFAELSDHVFPVLERFGLTATVYVPTAYMGRTSQWLSRIGEGGRPLLSVDDMAAAAATAEFGAHSHSHPALDTLPVAEAREEIVRSKQALEDALGRPVSSFAYPFGYERRSTRALVREAGYTSACRVGYRHSATHEDVYALSRVPVFADTDIQPFDLLLRSDASMRARRALALAWRPVRRAVAAR